MSDLELALRNSIQRQLWRQKRAAGTTFPDPWPSAERHWYDWYLTRERLCARLYLACQRVLRTTPRGRTATLIRFPIRRRFTHGR